MMNESGYYYSHQPILAAAMAITTGPVLELGSGLGSTLMLHGLCGAMGRELVTLESDEEWMLKFLNLGRAWHKFRHVKSYLNLPEYDKKWGLAFVDHGISGDLEAAKVRGHSVEMLQDVPIVIAHDTCYFWLYKYEEPLKLFKYRWDWRAQYELWPMTSVISKTVDVAKIFAEFGL
jgi:hypothetical protein